MEIHHFFSKHFYPYLLSLKDYILTYYNANILFKLKNSSSNHQIYNVFKFSPNNLIDVFLKFSFFK